MARSKLSTRVDQVVELLSEGMARGRWRETLPGRDRLAEEIGCSHSTVEAALRRLAKEGWLVSQGAGKRRRIVLPEGKVKASEVRVRILLYEHTDRTQPFDSELLTRLRSAGFAADFALMSLQQLGMRVDRVARFVTKTPADIWIVVSANREILEWFAGQPIPAIAMFGRFTSLPIAAVSPRKAPAMVAAVQKLAALGHQRMVMLVREERRKPVPVPLVQDFLDELKRMGLLAGSFNLPDWKESALGLNALLEELFCYTAPTVIIVDEPYHLYAILQFMARRGISTPEKVSLLCCDADPAFAWSHPQIAHIRWDHDALVKNVMSWVRRVVDGRADKRQILYDAELVEGGTIGPPPKEQ